MADDGVGGAIGGAAELGIGAATGNPLAMLGGAASLFGIGLSLFGSSQASEDAAKEAQISGNVAGLQMQENQVRQDAMEMAGRRQQIETARQSQLTAARNLATGVGQTGGTTSSSVQAGQQQATSEGNFQDVGIAGNLELGRKMFGLDMSIDQQKIQLASIQGSQASAQGLSSLGSGIASGGLDIMKMFGR